MEYDWITASIYMLVFVGAAVLGHWLTGAARTQALKRNVMDNPNHRSSHTTPTPRGGGIAIVIAITALVILATGLGIIPSSIGLATLVGGTLVAAIGFVDDHRPMRGSVRFLIHLVASGMVLWLLDANLTIYLPEWDWSIEGAWVAVLIIALTWLINLYNFMDGIDGIASIEFITVIMGAAFIGAGQQSMLAPTLLLLTAPVLGFLTWNWAPAKIFMGDGCSGYLGLLLGTLAIWTSTPGTSAHTGLNAWCWLILLGAFIVDSGWTLMVRLLTGQNWHQPHRSHCYQILSRRLGSHSKVSAAVAILNLVWLMPLAAWAAVHPELGLYFCSLAYLPLLLLCAAFGAGNPDK